MEKKEKDMARMMVNILNGKDVEDYIDVNNTYVQTFEEAGMVTEEKGFLLSFDNAEVFEFSVKRVE